MKLRTTTPASKSFTIKWATAFVVLIIVVTSAVVWVYRPVSADQYDDKIRALQADMSRYQAESDRLNAEATSLANALAQITNEKNALQSQVNLSQAQYDQLVVQIADTEKQIKENQDALGATIASLYVDDEISPVEMLASSKDIGEFLNKQEYRNSIKKELTSTITRVQDLKIQLSDQKVAVEKVLNDQKFARDQLIVKESEQANLVAQTRNDEVAYQGMIKDSAAQIAAAKATQAALRARSNSTGGYQIVSAGSLAGYPWNSSNCAMSGYMSTGGYPGTDGEDGYGYGCRQCVSYVAYRVAQATGKYYDNLGNGGSAAYNMVVKNKWTNLGKTPEKGAVASMWGTWSAPYSNNSNPGHTAYVEDVSADGTKVLVSQYNYDYGQGYGMYSEMWLSTNFFNQYAKMK